MKEVVPFIHTVQPPEANEAATSSAGICAMEGVGQMQPSGGYQAGWMVKCEAVGAPGDEHGYVKDRAVCVNRQCPDEKELYGRA